MSPARKSASPNAKPKPSGELRQSQLLTTFGPGAMVDLPDRSVIISGLSYWKGHREPIREERLAYKVLRTLQDRHPHLTEVKLYAPPVQSSDPRAAASGIDAFVFPTWFLGQVDHTLERNGKIYRTRPLVPWGTVKGGLIFEGKRIPAVPVRFVQACPNGHLSDIDWRAFAHQDFQSNCRGQLWLDEAGSGNDFEEIFVRCEQCHARRPLSQAKVNDSKVLGVCEGHRPWLGPQGREECRRYRVSEAGEIVATPQREYNRLLVRSASNAYFSQVLSVISMRDTDAELKKAVDRFYEEDLQFTEDIDDVKKELRKPKFADLVEFGADTVWAEIQRRKAGEEKPDKSIKQVELEALLACPEEKGKEPPTDNDTTFQGYRRPPASLTAPWPQFLNSIVLVHRLREVSALIGFTRFEAPMPTIDGEIDDLELGVRRASLDFEPQWVPAIENLGEGVFLSFQPDLIHTWLARPAVIEREKVLKKGFSKWANRRGLQGDRVQFPGAAYVMLHSLSHLLITAVSLECGYASSAIRERIYAFPEVGYGILLHTGTSGSEGTLGGLVEVGRHIEQHLRKALMLGQLCSNDPVCASHTPNSSQEDRFLHGAACHGCLLIAETSCERRNEMLDRALVVPTVKDPGAAFFPGGRFSGGKA
jgi:hypothetical protein